MDLGHVSDVEKKRWESVDLGPVCLLCVCVVGKEVGIGQRLKN